MLFTFPTATDANAFTDRIRNKISVEVLDVSEAPPFKVLISTPGTAEVLTRLVVETAARHHGMREPDPVSLSFTKKLQPDGSLGVPNIREPEPKTVHPPKRGYSARGLALTRVPKVPLWQCQDCLRRADDYMVKHTVWREAFKTPPDEPKAPGALCFECLEGRLDRLLQLDDFPRHIPTNRGIYLGASLVAATTD